MINSSETCSTARLRPWPPFDLTQFLLVSSALQNFVWTNARLKRSQDSTPILQEQTVISEVQGVLNNLVVAPREFTKCQLDEVRQIGPFKEGNMMAVHNVADLIFIIKTLHTKDVA